MQADASIAHVAGTRPLRMPYVLPALPSARANRELDLQYGSIRRVGLIRALCDGVVESCLNSLGERRTTAMNAPNPLLAASVCNPGDFFGRTKPLCKHSATRCPSLI